jgi:hypothetical protein
MLLVVFLTPVFSPVSPSLHKLAIPSLPSKPLIKKKKLFSSFLASSHTTSATIASLDNIGDKFESDRLLHLIG